MIGENKYLIIYHKEDNDGVFSAALMQDYIMARLGIDAGDIDLMPADYNDMETMARKCSPSELSSMYSNLIMVDISFNEKWMKSLYNEMGNKLVWCDHHSPIILASHMKKFDDILGVRETNRSAILCVWKYLYDQFDEQFKKRKCPLLLRALSAWDSFSYAREKMTLDYARHVNIGTDYKVKLDISNAIEVVHDIVSVYVDGKDGIAMDVKSKDKKLVRDLEKIGKMLCSYDDRKNADLVMRYGDCTWQVEALDGSLRSACALFLQGPSSSMMFKSLPSSIENGIVFKRNIDSSWSFSLYNTSEQDKFHCGELLKARYGGGGHSGAAGCTIKEPTFLKILKTKKI